MATEEKPKRYTKHSQEQVNQPGVSTTSSSAASTSTKSDNRQVGPAEETPRIPRPRRPTQADDTLEKFGDMKVRPLVPPLSEEGSERTAPDAHPIFATEFSRMLYLVKVSY